MTSMFAQLHTGKSHKPQQDVFVVTRLLVTKLLQPREYQIGNKLRVAGRYQDVRPSLSADSGVPSNNFGRGDAST